MSGEFLGRPAREEDQMKYLAALLLFALALGSLRAAESKEPERLQESADVINEVMETPEKGIPRDLFDKAVCVGIIPHEPRLASAVVAWSYGRGALVCRRGGTGSWGGPAMFTIHGPNHGLWIGNGPADFVLLVMNASGAEKLLKGKPKLGADVSVAAGPIGRTAEESLAVLPQTEILSYMRCTGQSKGICKSLVGLVHFGSQESPGSRGVLVGMSLEGQVIKQDNHGNERLYGRKVDPREILFGGVEAPEGAAALDAVLTKYSPHGGQKSSSKGSQKPTPPRAGAQEAGESENHWIEDADLRFAVGNEKDADVAATLGEWGKVFVSQDNAATAPTNQGAPSGCAR
jgi:SH3 domain-containing YSC84-like protein 1